jgi:hypothetical protein
MVLWSASSDNHGGGGPISAASAARRSLPVFPYEQTMAAPVDMSQRCPTTDSCSAANRFGHSITSSARAKRDGGIVNPSALAVFRLMTSSTLVLCWIGRSAGLAPLRIFPT